MQNHVHLSMYSILPLLISFNQVNIVDLQYQPQYFHNISDSWPDVLLKHLSSGMLQQLSYKYTKTLKTIEKTHNCDGMWSQWHDSCYGDRRCSPTKRDHPYSDTSFCLPWLSTFSWVTIRINHLNWTLKSGVSVAWMCMHVHFYERDGDWCVREEVKQCYVNIFICE